jgi:CBS domain-containing protein
MRILVKDFMSSPVVTATGDSSVREIRALMKAKGIHAIPITSNPMDTTKEMIIRGIVTTSDISKDVHRDAVMENVMTDSNVQVIHVDATAEAAAKMMLRHKVHHIVVMDDGKIKGMISALDFVKIVAEYDLQ